MGLRRNARRRDEERGAHGAHDAPRPHGASGREAAVELRGVRRQYGRGSAAVHALRGIDLTLPRGTFTAVMGPSGSGKSTFLQCAAGLDRPTSGSIYLGETDLAGLSEDALSRLRRESVGFVFQSFNLVPSLSAVQNITLPLRLGKRK